VPPLVAGSVPLTSEELSPTALAETAPLALVWRIPDGALETVRLVVLAVPKYPSPLALSAVVDAYVAFKTVPFASVSAPVDEKVEVPVPPK